MNFKNYIAAVFIVFSLAFSFSNVNFSHNQKPHIINIIETDNDSVTEGFLKKNEDMKRHIRTALSIKIFLINSYSDVAYFNSS